MTKTSHLDSLVCRGGLDTFRSDKLEWEINIFTLSIKNINVETWTPLTTIFLPGLGIICLEVR